MGTRFPGSKLHEVLSSVYIHQKEASLQSVWEGFLCFLLQPKMQTAVHGQKGSQSVCNLSLSADECSSLGEHDECLKPEP